MVKPKINEINDIFYAETKPFIENILENKVCPNCSGSRFDGYECIYCGIENIYVKNFLEKIEDTLNKYENETKDLVLSSQWNKFFNLLFSVSNLNISIIDDFLDKYDYKNYALKNYDKILDKIYCNKELLETEIDFLDLMIWMNCESVDYGILYAYFFRQTIMKKINISYKSFKHMLKIYVEDVFLNIYNSKISCEIVPHFESCINDLDKYVVGSATHFSLYLGEEIISALYYNGDVELFHVIGHEMFHLYQLRFCFNTGNIIGFGGITCLKDYILAANNKYYKDNYDNVIFELEAEIKGKEFQKNILLTLGFELNPDKYQSDREELFARMKDKRRIVNGEETTVDVEFEKFIYNHPEIFLRFPKLARLYKIEGNNVILKSNDELNNDLKEILENPEIHEEYKKQIQLFYDEYINGDFKKLKKSKD